MSKYIQAHPLPPDRSVGRHSRKGCMVLASGSYELRLPPGFQAPPHLMGPDSELPEPPRWYRGTRMQWQTDRHSLAIAYALEAQGLADNLELHAATPAPVYYSAMGVLRMQVGGTNCGCWHCGGSQGPELESRLQRLRAKGWM